MSLVNTNINTMSQKPANTSQKIELSTVPVWYEDLPPSFKDPANIESIKQQVISEGIKHGEPRPLSRLGRFVSRPLAAITKSN